MYSYPTRDGQQYSLTDGMGTMRALHPWLADLPCASRTSGDAIKYETIAAARPQVVILRIGDCTVGRSPEVVSRMTGVFEAMGIPVVVLRSPADYRGQSLDTLRAEIDVLGRLFEAEGEASALAGELRAAEAMVQSRVRDVPDGAKPRVLYLGLASNARSSGGAAYVWGIDSAESWMIERIVGARNAYRGPGSRVLLNAEQILALDPDVIFLPTSAGFHPPRELAEAPYFRELQRLRAVREQRVYPLPWTPMNCARRLEYPLDLLGHGERRLPGPLPRHRRARVGAGVLPADLPRRRRTRPQRSGGRSGSTLDRGRRVVGTARALREAAMAAGSGRDRHHGRRGAGSRSPTHDTTCDAPDPVFASAATA